MKVTKLLTSTAVGAALVLGASAVQAKELTVVSWGGAYTKSQVEAYHKPYIAKTGVKINSEDYNGGIAEIKAQVEAGNVTWDIVDVELVKRSRAFHKISFTNRLVSSFSFQRSTAKSSRNPFSSTRRRGPATSRLEIASRGAVIRPWRTAKTTDWT